MTGFSSTILIFQSFSLGFLGKVVSLGTLCAKFIAFKEGGGLVFPSTVGFNVVRITASVFHRHVVGTGTSIPNDKNTDLKIQSIVFEQMGT